MRKQLVMQQISDAPACYAVYNDNRRLSVIDSDKNVIQIQQKEIFILRCLIENPDKLFSYAALQEKSSTKPLEFFDDIEGTMQPSMYDLKKRCGSPEHWGIKNVKKGGYKFCPHDGWLCEYATPSGKSIIKQRAELNKLLAEANCGIMSAEEYKASLTLLPIIESSAEAYGADADSEAWLAETIKHIHKKRFTILYFLKDKRIRRCTL